MFRRFLNRKRFLVISSFFVVASFLSFLLWMMAIDISDFDHPLPEPTFIFDRNGEVVSQLSSSNVTPVPLADIPVHLQEAIIAVEDKRFYDHQGIDAFSIFRAMFQNIKAGKIAEGGSTITQQLAKNMFLTSEKTFIRKFKEAGIALKAEFIYSKEEILELYLNKIYFGEGTWGIQEAAKVYFGKNANELTVAEAALLAGLPKAPTHYSPIKNKEKALARRNIVLSLMHEQGYLSTTEYEKIESEPIVLAKEQRDDLKGNFPSYVDFIIEEAVTKYGFTEEQILTSGLHIYTSLDSKIQRTMETAYQNDRFFPESKDDQLIQSGAIVLDPYTGGVPGLVGYRGEHLYRAFNHATQLKRQPGSTFKPLAVYAPALEKGYTPFSTLYDGKLNIDGYQPDDWDGKTRGTVTLYEAVVQSWNIPAVWLLNEIGIKTGINFVNKLGIPLTENDQNLGIALGGLTEGVSPLQMAQAYGTFPNLGTMIEAHGITKITTKDEHVLIQANPKKTKMMSPSNAYLMTMLLQDAVGKGTGKNAALPRPVAGKTGTTQLPDIEEFKGIKGNKDAWFVGYTPELVTAVWMGYDQTDRNHYLQTSGGKHPAVLFRQIMSNSLKDVPMTHFKQPVKQ